MFFRLRYVVQVMNWLFAAIISTNMKTAVTRLAFTVLFAASLLLSPVVASPLVSYQDAVAQQQEDGWSTIKAEDGLVFVWNVRGLYFSLALKGKDIKPLDDPDHIFFNVDGRILQIQLTAINNFAPDAKEKKLADRAILAAHRDWEAKYIEDLVHSKLTVRTFNAKLSNGNDASMWQFDMPEGMNADAQKQLYLTLVAKDYVLMLNSEATAGLSEGDGRKFLLDTIATLKLSPTPIDVQKLAESLRKD
jgi:hypothetical protein